MLLRMVGSTVSDVSMKEDVGYEAVMGIIGRRAAGETDWKERNKEGSLVFCGDILVEYGYPISLMPIRMSA